MSLITAVMSETNYLMETKCDLFEEPVVFFHVKIMACFIV